MSTSEDPFPTRLDEPRPMFPRSIGGVCAPKGPPGSLLLFECNTLHASNANMSPWPRANLFFVYNSVDNYMEDPYCGNDPRPEHLGARGRPRPLDMCEPDAQRAVAAAGG